MATNVNKTERDKALEAAIAQIDKRFGKGSIMSLGDDSARLNIEAIPTGSISLDIACGVGGDDAVGRDGTAGDFQGHDFRIQHVGLGHFQIKLEGIFVVIGQIIP